MSRFDSLALFVREDVRDTIRERQLYALVGIYALLGLFLVYAEAQSIGTEPELTPVLFSFFTMLTPLLALGFFASSIVEKRTNGAFKIVFGLPVGRGAVVVGTFLARTLVVCAAVVVGMIVTVPVGAVLGVAIDPAQFVGVAALLSLLGAAFTAFAVGISAVVRTSTRATVAAFGVFVLFFFQLWAQLPRAVLYVVNGFSYPETTPEWVDLVAALNPMSAYANLAAGLSADLGGGTFASPPTDPVFYEEPAFGLAVLLGWVVLAIGGGYWRFQATDL
ncbi:ABC transporter permease subunit [Natronolimnohabitans innermongolicus]|uniref:ABC transporter n=1 Tax=Natronolimnohabitans innermongolicus JCM 12255 TaxID=1227499 RepID=L9WZD2_9EURY|nr:ABC transporter permease subunit [Natronolimnohabitans innermongolicus]ELY54835.1 hypothetical protein C493_12062 [Natronolimnohabitans innermongolicus JCM 12255]